MPEPVAWIDRDGELWVDTASRVNRLSRNLTLAESEAIYGLRPLYDYGERVYAGDPRLKLGARVRIEWEPTGWSWVLDADNPLWEEQDRAVYLLAEAPDPDADARKALADALDSRGWNYNDNHDIRGLLEALRLQGFTWQGMQS